jgi:hypothetical protein
MNLKQNKKRKPRLKSPKENVEDHYRLIAELDKLSRDLDLAQNDDDPQLWDNLEKRKNKLLNDYYSKVYGNVYYVSF